MACSYSEVPHGRVRSIFFLSFLLSVFTGLFAQQNFIDWQEPIFAITDVSLIDGSGGPVRKHQTIVIDLGIIVAVGPVDSLILPADVSSIDGRGLTLIPGIIGVHNHLHMPGSTFLGSAAARLYLSAGVTTIMTCGAAEPARELLLAEQVRMGVVSGPEIVPSGPYLTGSGGNPSMVIPRGEKDIRDTIRYWSARGINWFKVYRHTPPEDLAIIMDEAHRLGAKVTGHLCATTFAEAARLGIDGIEHGLNSASDFRTGKSTGKCDGKHDYMDTIDPTSEKVTNLLTQLIEANVSLTSTLAIYESSIPGRNPVDDRSLRAMTPLLRERYAGANLDTADASRLARLHRIMTFERRFVEMGGLLAAGPDPGRHNLPGYGDQRNFELLREAGFPAEEAVQVMTGNGAKVLGRSDIGTVTVGKRADLVLLKGDLEANPEVIRKVVKVFRQGIGYTVEQLTRSTEGLIGPEN